MQLVIDDVESQAPVILHPEPMTDDAYFDFCQRYPNFRIERTSQGEIVIMPPAGFETSFRNSDLVIQLGTWAKKNGKGKCSGPDAEFLLPDGSALSPDAAWVSNADLEQFTRPQKRKFLRLVPAFVVELTSPTDRLPQANRKMDNWMSNGVQLGWLIHGDSRTVYVYRPGRSTEEIIDAAEVKGEGPVGGFVLQLADIFAGL